MSGSSVVVFDYTMWSTRYPELAPYVSSDLATLYFNEATLYLDNTSCSPVSDPTQRALLLNMLVSHIAKLNATINGQAPSGLVGRISSATEGSVSVSTDMAGVPGSAAWFAMTPYGFAFWQATAALRTFRYIPRPCMPGPFGFYGRRF